MPEKCMFQFEVNDTFIVEQRKILEAALSTNPKTEKALQKLIRRALMDARRSLSAYISAKLDSDPRAAARAVRTTVYRRVLGGNINIFNSKKAHGSSSYEPPRTLRPGQRGGNRRPRSGTTKRIMNYSGIDRGFILRWVNEGTKQRAIKHLVEIKRPGSGSKFRWKSEASVYGNRGMIAPRNFFMSGATPRMQEAAEYLADLIDEELEKMFNLN